MNAHSVLDHVAEALRKGQRSIETLNTEANRDFGTTCVTVSIIVSRYRTHNKKI